MWNRVTSAKGSRGGRHECPDPGISDPEFDPLTFHRPAFSTGSQFTTNSKKAAGLFSSSYYRFGSSRSSNRQQLDVFQRQKCPPNGQNIANSALVQNQYSIIRQKTRLSEKWFLKWAPIGKIRLNRRDRFQKVCKSHTPEKEGPPHQNIRISRIFYLEMMPVATPTV